MSKKAITSTSAPAAIGPYSQAIQVGNTIWLSGQIGLDPATMTLVEGLDAQAEQVFKNLQAVAKAAGAGLDHAVRITVYLVDLADFAKVNEVMMKYFSEPYPARATVGVKALPRGALVEADTILYLD